ncbi:hypothetical protein CMEL01_11017 [Colletotrichum melonis]|uniref:EC29 protein n=1 Tax=Colletotrichum melonis TaxID=1209925 RepID=A0AAI9UY79_9PEZI|nr:hypothetical protein CMEL01_11017 [Colletotrichum melonis]
MFSHTLVFLAATLASLAQGLPTEQLDARQTVCSLNEKTWTATMTGSCNISGGPAMACDMRTDLKTLVVQKNTMISASGLGNNKWSCEGYQQWQCCSS